MRPWMVPIGVALLALVLMAVALVKGGSGAAPAKPSAPAPASPAVAASSQVGGAFTLVDQKGRAVTDADLKGKPTLMFFGFTYCPDVCPTTLTHLTAWMKALGPDADKLNVVFVTVDPERDTPKQMALYLSSFDPRIRGLTGTPGQVSQVAHAYNVYYQKVPIDGGGYTMDHSTSIYLMDGRGAFSSTMDYQTPTDEAVMTLHQLIHA